MSDRKLKYHICLDDFLLLPDGSTVYRIQADRSFGNVKEGEYGGYVGNMSNLSQTGTAWIYDEAVAYGQSRVEEDAQLRKESVISDMVRISGHAQVIHTKISGDMQIGDYAKVCGNQDYVEIRGLLFEEHPIFFFRLVSGKIGVQFQDFSGDLAQFKRYVQKIPKMKTRKELWMLLCLIQYQFQERMKIYEDPQRAENTGT